jgi:hypothetical protein
VLRENAVPHTDNSPDDKSLANCVINNVESTLLSPDATKIRLRYTQSTFCEELLFLNTKDTYIDQEPITDLLSFFDQNIALINRSVVDLL